MAQLLSQHSWILGGLLSLLCLGLASILALTKLKLKNKLHLPPGPLPFPLIGNLHNIGQLPHRSTRDLAKKHGPILFLRLGSFPAIIISSPQMAMEILKTHDAAMASRPATSAGKYMAYNYADIVGAPYGQYWWRMRKLCVHHLLSPKALHSFRSVREEEITSAISSIYKHYENPESPCGGVVNYSKLMATMMTNILCRMAVGRSFCDDSTEGKRFREIIHEMFFLTGATNIGDLIPCLDWMDLQGFKHRQKKVHRAFDAFAEKMIEEHGIVNRTKVLKADFVDVLLDISREKRSDMEVTRDNVKALILDMVVAGTDTTIAALDWAMSELLRNPSVMAKAQQELDAIVGNKRNVQESDLPHLEYLHCIVNETLRLYPSLPLLIPHLSMEWCTVAGYQIPPKTWIFVNAWAIGRDIDTWGDDAEKFRPERFLERFSEGVRRGDVDDFKWIPFGWGRRGCPGMSLARVVVLLTLARLLHSFEWKGLPHQDLDMRETFKFTLSRATDLEAIATPRLALA